MNQPNAGSGSGVSGHAFFVTMLLATLGGAFCGYVGDYVALAVIVVTAAGAAFGYWKGALGFIALGAAIAAGYFFAQPVDQIVGPHLSSFISDHGWLSPSVRIGFSGIVTAGLTQLVIILVGKSILSRNEVLCDLNRTAGLGIGGLQMFSATVCFLCGLLVIEPLLQPGAVPASSRSAAIAGSVSSIAQRTRVSMVHPVLVQCDPFQRFPALKQSLQTMSQTGGAMTPLATQFGSGSLTGSVVPSESQLSFLNQWVTASPNSPPGPSQAPLNSRSLQTILQELRSGNSANQ